MALINQQDRNYRRCVETISDLEQPLLCFTEAIDWLGEWAGIVQQAFGCSASGECWFYIPSMLNS
ncbi:hypothetical protein HRE53_12335 [Acaryochloris sp. 'Moss Beach']|uniref:hypothetical protein n=1 Tax=Acaryochloris sp. 'Moss Beach' TaxID=2740837 RepID=UPI001F2771B3|nr:hypothetical protein [Acaryochloris sp. 'Moss Beach']UJB71670.1 hypothetical protein HRE53_12335 [Acaryochloris sp. 'Moss Beach']